MDLVGGAGEELEIAGGDADIGAGLAQRLAGIAGLEFGEIVGMIKARLPKADISYGPGPLRFVDGTESVKKGALSIERAKRELGYKPRWTMETGLNAWIDLLLTGKG